MTTRRNFLRRAVLGSSLVGGSVVVTPAIARLASATSSRQAVDDDVRIVPFVGESSRRVGRVYGQGLGGRLVVDLKSLNPDRLVVPNDRFFIRTRRPDGLDALDLDQWTVKINGLVESELDVEISELVEQAVPQGIHLLECSGNFRSGGFGLLSAAQWSGVPVLELLERVTPTRRATRVRIAGFDEHSRRMRGSTAGASWVFTFDDLKSTGAFLATHMNGEPLPDDHGFPVRLVVPGWYGCTSAKWVDHIELVDDTTAATSQMREFASRTHQRGRPRLARDYRPAEMDQAAMPVRVEQHERDGRVQYRVVGILWGGKRPVDRLSIQLGEDAPYRPVTEYRHTTNQTWSLWSYDWQPETAGKYAIRMKVDDPGVRTRRLDSGFYQRTVEIVA